jgi:transcriptional regulator with XRE-family HTH domain
LADVQSVPERSFLAREIRRRRDERRLTAQQLADRVVAAGGKLSRQAISKIENGERGVAVEELLLLAKALGTPPALLLFPLGREQETEILPGQAVPTWDAVKWFTGFQPFPGKTVWKDGKPVAQEVDADDLRAWRATGQAVQMYWEHERLVQNWVRARGDAANSRRMADGAVSDEARAEFLQESDKAASRAAVLERILASHREYMRRNDVEPERLRDDLSHIDADDAPPPEVRDPSDPASWMPDFRDSTTEDSWGDR